MARGNQVIGTPGPGRARDEVDSFISTGITHIPGWFSRTDATIFRLIDRVQSEEGVSGDLLEIGVYLGKSAALMGYLRRPGERFVVCDPFEGDVPGAGNRTENATYYPELRVDGFVANYRRFHDDLPEIIVEPSSALSVDELGGGAFRLVHVDGSHLHEAVRADIALTRELLGPGGVVAFDDVFAPHAPGVAAAVWEACATAGLRPLCVTGKLYAMWEDDAERGDRIVARLRTLARDEPLVAFEDAQVHGHTVLWTFPIEPRWRRIAEGVVPPAAKPLVKAGVRAIGTAVARLRRRSPAPPPP